MLQFIGIIFIAFVVIKIILSDKKSSEEFYKNEIKNLQSKNESLQFLVNNLQGKLDVKSVETKKLNKDKVVNNIDINKAKSIVKRKDGEYGKNINLEDFVLDSIERNGLKKTKELYNGLVKVFELSGRDISRNKKIYNKYF